MNRSAFILAAAIFYGGLPPGRAAADIAPNPMTGGRSIGPYGDRATEVRMVEEDVVVRIFADSIVTVASFVMHNGGETAEMQVGFPFNYPDDLIEFRAFIDGNPVDFRDAAQEVSVGRKKGTVYWKLWDMTFLGDERCTIRIEYRTKPMLNPAGTFGGELYTLPDDVRFELERACTIGRTEYFLTTGKAWKGVLDRCRVTFELAGLTNTHILAYTPQDGAVTDNGVAWEYTDYEPAGFVTLRYCPNMPAGQIPGFLRGYADSFSGYAPLADDKRKEPTAMLHESRDRTTDYLAQHSRNQSIRSHHG